MTEITALWLPILLSAVVVFFASWIIHMLLPWHRKDFPKVPDEDRVMDTIRPLGIPAGEYMIPRASSPQDMKSPEFREKLAKGPVLMMNVFPPGPFSMGKSLFQWFVYCVVVGVLAGYVAGVALPAVVLHFSPVLLARSLYERLATGQTDIWYPVVMLSGWAVLARSSRLANSRAWSRSSRCIAMLTCQSGRWACGPEPSPQPATLWKSG